MSGKLSADHLYDLIRGAFRALDGDTFAAATDFGSVAKQHAKWPSCGEDPPPPRSGGTPYHALAAIHGYATDARLIFAFTGSDWEIVEIQEVSVDHYGD